jgi:chromosome segregation ATPase
VENSLAISQVALVNVNETIADREVEIAKLNIEVKSRENQINVLNNRLSVMKSELATQLELLTAQFQSTNNMLTNKSSTVSQTIQNLVDRAASEDARLEKYYFSLQEKMKDLESALSAKESLVQMLTGKLHTSAETLREREELHSSEIARLRSRIQGIEDQLRLGKMDLSKTLQERSLINTELKAQKELVFHFTSRLQEAETGSTHQEAQFVQMQKLLEEMKDDLRLQAQKLSTIESADEDHEKRQLVEQIDQLRALYFQAVCLLAKVQLFYSKGTMQSILVEDLYTEVLDKNLTLDEWPAYVFHRLPQMNSKAEQRKQSIFPFKS